MNIAGGWLIALVSTEIGEIGNQSSFFECRDDTYCGMALDVKPTLVICRIFAALAILGLVLSPLVWTAAAMPTDVQQTGMSEHARMVGGAMDHSATPVRDGMPCCPDQAPMSDCGKSCLMNLCAASMFPTLPNRAWLAVPAMISAEVVFARHRALSGFSQPPPPKPPRA